MLHVLAFAGVAVIGAVVGWRLTGVRARFTGAGAGARDGCVRGGDRGGFRRRRRLRGDAVDRTGCARWTQRIGSSGATVVAAGLAAVAYLYFAAVSLLLAEVDVATHRLPNAIVLPAYPVLAILLAAACLAGGSWALLGRAAAGGGILFGFFWPRPRLGAVPGRAVARRARRRRREARGCDRHGPGIHRRSALALGALAAFLFGGVAAIALLLCGRATRRTAIAFGPFLSRGVGRGARCGGSALG
jgi:leader peptidase (prepilin peptidase)/N-methyltransferase